MATPHATLATAFRSGNVNAAVWENTGEKGTFFSVSFSRPYKDAQGQWKVSSSYSLNDLDSLSSLAELAKNWVRGHSRQYHQPEASRSPAWASIPFPQPQGFPIRPKASADSIRDIVRMFFNCTTPDRTRLPKKELNRGAPLPTEGVPPPCAEPPAATIFHLSQWIALLGTTPDLPSLCPYVSQFATSATESLSNEWARFVPEAGTSSQVHSG